MTKKNLSMKSALKPVTDADLSGASGGGPRPTIYGCCVTWNGIVGTTYEADTFNIRGGPPILRCDASGKC